MTTIVLVRHSSVEAIGNWLAGRRLGLPLNDRGLNEATTLVDRMACFRITAIYSSPMQRAVETASPLAQRLSLEIRVRDEFNEFDFGEWTGKRFDELDSLTAWRRFNQFRATASIPGGENMLAVAARMVTGIESLRELSRSDNAKVVFMPVETSSVLSSIGAFKEVFGEQEKGVPVPVRARQPEMQRVRE